MHSILDIQHARSSLSCRLVPVIFPSLSLQLTSFHCKVAGLSEEDEKPTPFSLVSLVDIARCRRWQSRMCHRQTHPGNYPRLNLWVVLLLVASASVRAVFSCVPLPLFLHLWGAVCHRRVRSRGGVRWWDVIILPSNWGKQVNIQTLLPLRSWKVTTSCVVSRKSQRKERVRVLARLDRKCVFMASTVLELCQGALCWGGASVLVWCRMMAHLSFWWMDWWCLFSFSWWILKFVSLPSLLALRDLKCLLDMRPVNMPLQFWKRPCRFWHRAVNLTIFLQFKNLPGGEGTWKQKSNDEDNIPEFLSAGCRSVWFSRSSTTEGNSSFGEPWILCTTVCNLQGILSKFSSDSLGEPWLGFGRLTPWRTLQTTLVFWYVYTSSHDSLNGIKSYTPLQSLSWVHVLWVHANLLYGQPISSSIPF